MDIYLKFHSISRNDIQMLKVSNIRYIEHILRYGNVLKSRSRLAPPEAAGRDRPSNSIYSTYVYIDIEMSPGIEFGEGEEGLRWRVDTAQSKVCRQLGKDEKWPADNGVRRRWRTLGLLRSRGLLEQPQTRGMGESAFLPSTPLPLATPHHPSSPFATLCHPLSLPHLSPPGYVPNGLRIPERRGGAKRWIFLLTIIPRCFPTFDTRCFNNVPLLLYLGCLKLGLFTPRILIKKSFAKWK